MNPQIVAIIVTLYASAPRLAWVTGKEEKYSFVMKKILLVFAILTVYSLNISVIGCAGAICSESFECISIVARLSTVYVPISFYLLRIF